MTVFQISNYWIARCECGWSSGTVPFPDPDAAYHCGHLHDAVAHPAMTECAGYWRLSWRTDPIARAIADEHYNRQSIGAQDFMPPGRCLVLLGDDEQALWGTSWPLAEFVKHAWAGAWVNSTFRRRPVDERPEDLRGGPHSSDLIREAVAITRWRWPIVPPLGMVTMIDPDKTKQVKVRGVPVVGFSYLKAGFEHVGFTKGGLWVFQMTPDRMPQAAAPLARLGALMAV